MNYHERVMAYADVLQIFSPDQAVLYNTLNDKIAQYATTGNSPKELAFWTEVLGRLCRRVWFKEIAELIDVEKKNLNNIEEYPDITSLNRTPSTRLWIKSLPMFRKEVYGLLDYQRDYGIKEKPSEDNRYDSCWRSLKFINDAVTKDLPLTQLFSYIPLAVWSVENLLMTKNWHTDFNDVVTLSLIPLLRGHHAAVLSFLELVSSEEPFTKEERELAKASIFKRDYTPKTLELSIPLDPRDMHTAGGKMSSAEDPFLDDYSRSLRAFVEEELYLGPLIDQCVQQHFLSPLSHIHRLFLHAEMLGCQDEYVPVVSPTLIKSVSRKLYVHEKVYSEERLLASCLLGVDNILNEFGTTPYVDLYTIRYGDAIERLEKKLQGLIEEGLITAGGFTETLEYAKLRGEAYGIYSR
jgi:hypothetical protein